MLEIIEKDITKSKLTITPTRQLLKMPPEISVDDRKRLVRFSETIIEKIFPAVVQSLRGQFIPNTDGKYTIILEDNSRKQHLIFVEE